jgi:hypothetical protein
MVDLTMAVPLALMIGSVLLVLLKIVLVIVQIRREKEK